MKITFHIIVNTKENNVNIIKKSSSLSRENSFFDQSFVHDEEYDLYVHSHLFEHIYDPVSFAKKLSDFIPEGRDLIFSVPNIKEMLIRKYTNALNFEHTFLHLFEEL